MARRRIEPEEDKVRVDANIVEDPPTYDELMAHHHSDARATRRDS